VPDHELLASIRAAWEAADLDAVTALLAPDVTWGAPGDPKPPCRNRDQVRAWYERSFNRGVRGSVVNVSWVGENVLVGLLVTDPENADTYGGQVERWQVLAIRDGLIADIRGYEDRGSAVAAAT
jgi:ketosteroid isomerase-like protein